MADRDRRIDEGRGADEGFLQRWSRRKAGARSAAIAPAEDPTVAAEGRPTSLAETSEPTPGEAASVAPEDLPDIESLDASSDFSAFMRPGVPAHLRAEALRKLWRADPIFSKLDGLVEYGEDYTIQSWPKGAIRTAYQIGRGFVNELEKLGGADVPCEKPAPEPAGDADAAITSAEGDQPLDLGANTPEPRVGATQAEVEPASGPPASAPAKPRPRALPRRG